MSHVISEYPLAINGSMGAMGLTKEERQAQAAQRKIDAQKRQQAAQAQRQQAQSVALQKRQQAQAVQQQKQQAAQAQRQQTQAAAQQQQAMRRTEAEKKRVVAQIAAEIRQIDAVKKTVSLSPEWVAYRACLEERLKDVARVCAKPGTTLQQVKKAAVEAKQSAKKEATKAAQDLRKKVAEDKRKTQQRLREEKKKKDKQTVQTIAPALKNQLQMLQRLAGELRQINRLPAAQKKAAADAILKKYPSDIVGTDAVSRLQGYGMGSMGDCKTVFVPGFGWREICDRPSSDWTPPPDVVGGNLFPETGPITTMPDSATYWDKRFEGRIGTKKDLTSFAFKACANKAYKKFPIEQALCWSSLWEDTPDSLRKYFPKKVVKTYQLSGGRMGAIDPITGLEITSDPSIPLYDPNAPGGQPISPYAPVMPTVPLPKGGCEGKKASKPICMFYTLAMESQQMLYTVVQQIIALQNEILLVLNEIRAGAGATGGSGYCDPSTGMWINPDGTTGGACGAGPVTDPNYYQDPGYPPQYPGYGGPTTQPPVMDYGGELGVPTDVYPGAPTTPYGYNQPYQPYQQIPDTMQLPADAAGGDIFSDVGVDFVPTEAVSSQYSMQQQYAAMPQMDFQQIPAGNEYGDDMFAADQGMVPGDISIYGAPSTMYQQAGPSLLAPDQTFVMPNYAQTEIDQPLVIQEAAPAQLDPFSALMIPDEAAAQAARFAQQTQKNQYDQNAILQASFDGGWEEDFF